jgi:UDP-N-acetylglucosamine 2-epimerase (non-hydrolysing)
MGILSECAPKKVFVVFGTRPEAIKLAPVILELEHRRDCFRTIVCTTGQHREMLAPMLEVFRLRADYNLDVMKSGQSLAEVTTAVLSRLDRVLREEQPDIVVVQGDTTTTFSASLAAFYHGIPVGHVEAGLRTQNKYSPFPEEINRRLATHIADFHFAPTVDARANLLLEGVSADRILVTGNTVIDALCHIRTRIAGDRSVVPDLGLHMVNGRRMILVTAHRRESFGKELQHICEALRSLAQNRPDLFIVYPVHLNPNVLEPVRRSLQGLPNLRLLAPLDYVSFVSLMEQASILLTDSGGIQEEGACLGKPVLVMREVSERPEAIAVGTACLVGTDPQQIVSAVNTLLDEPHAYERMIHRPNPYGDGHAASRIVDFLQGQVFPDRRHTGQPAG